MNNEYPTVTILNADCRDTLRTLEPESVQCCVTSPPYWGLRSYLPASHPDKAREIGQEKTPQEFVTALVAVFAEVRRVLKRDGTLFVNLGDCYASSSACARQIGLKEKDLIGVPWMVAFALRADGWILRSEITWCKKAPMPESVTDRPTSATEKIFLLTKSPKYYYDADAVRNPPSEAMLQQLAEGYNGEASKLFEDNGVQNASDVKSRIIENARKRIDKQRGHSRRHAGFNDRWDHLSKAEQMACGSNMRNYWLLGPAPYKGNHFATFPPEIPRRAILAGSKPGDTILDCFGGSGVTAEVAMELGRNSILIELNPEYVPLIEQRTNNTAGLL